MTESDYITELKARWPRKHSDEVSLETIALADEAIQRRPQSPQLWVIRGDLLQLGPEDCPYPLEESLVCYQRAIEIDPQFAEAWESAAHFYDAVMADPQAALPYFGEFERLKGHPITEQDRPSRTAASPPRVSVSRSRNFRTLKSPPIPDSGGGR